MNISKLLPLIEKYNAWIGLLGLVIGIIGTVASFWFYNSTRDDATIFFTRKTSVVYNAPKNFSYPIQNSGEASAAPVSEHVAMFWNVGPGIIRDTDVRVAPCFSVPPPGKILSAKILRNNSPVKDNFSLRGSTDPQNRECTELNFKLFDPGTAVAIALLSSGGEGSFTFGFRFGPRISFKQYSPQSNFYLLLLAAVGVTVLVFMTSISFIIRFVASDRFAASNRTKTFVQLVSYVLIAALSLAVFYFSLEMATEYLEGETPMKMLGLDDHAQNP